MKRVTFALVVLSALAASPVPAQGAPTPVEINIDGQGYSPTTANAEGTLSSARPACLSNRKVELYLVTAEGTELFDTDRSSDNGFFSGGGPVGDGKRKAVKVKVLASDPPGSVKCAGAVARSDFFMP